MLFGYVTLSVCLIGGLSLAPHLIKEVVQALRKDIPSIHTYSTLSPIPTFMKWLTRVNSFLFIVTRSRWRLVLSTCLYYCFRQVKDIGFVPRKHMMRIQAAAALINGENTPGEVLSDEQAWSIVVGLVSTKPGDFDSNAQLQSILKEPVRVTIMLSLSI